MEELIPLPKQLIKFIILPFIEHEKYLQACANKIICLQELRKVTFLNERKTASACLSEKYPLRRYLCLEEYSKETFPKGYFFTEKGRILGTKFRIRPIYSGEYSFNRIMETRYKMQCSNERSEYRCEITSLELTSDEKRIAQILGIL